MTLIIAVGGDKLIEELASADGSRIRLHSARISAPASVAHRNAQGQRHKAFDPDQCARPRIVPAACGLGDAVIIFDREITFEPDGAAVIWATSVDGSRIDGTRIKVSVTKQYAERTWRIRYSEEEVRRLVWVYIDDLRAAAAGAHASGRREVTLGEHHQ